jgi:hypothetical protein
MKNPSPKLVLFGLLAALGSASAADPAYWSWAKTPPMGWNSWDAFGSSVKEEQVLANADYMDKHLKSHGWDLVTIDIQYGVDMSKPGAQEYYDSVYKLMASWDLDFVKVDDLAGKRPEIEAIRKAIDKCGRPIVLSVSMGSGANQGEHLRTNANLWRVSFDFWDNWSALYNQFRNLNDHQPFQGPGHWPDADMLPFGHVKTWEVPAHYSRFTQDEQYTVMTLWSLAADHGRRHAGQRCVHPGADDQR